MSTSAAVESDAASLQADAALVKKFKLQTTIDTGNMNMYDEGGVIRHFFNTHHAGGRGKALAWQWPVAVLLAIGLIIFIASRGPALSDAKISDSRALEIITTHCAGCHAAEPKNPAFTAPPGGIVLDSLNAVRRHSERVMAQSVTSQAMPPGNASGMTDSERAELGQWLRLQR